MRFRVDTKNKSIMIGENKKPCYVTRLNVMGAFYALFSLNYSIPHSKFTLEKLGQDRSL